MKVVTIVGARPNFIKAALVSLEMKKSGIEEFMIHTGQHYDIELSDQIFRDLKIKTPNVNLNIGSGSHAYQTGKILMEIENILITQKPNVVVVYGDTNSTLSGALAAVKLKIPVVHVEAGERSFDKNMPEEINRIICDHISIVNCCATKIGVDNLKNEGITNGVFWTGDVMLDSMKKFIHLVKPPVIKLPPKFILITLHRAENTDSKIKLSKIILALSKIDFPLVWPLHPRTKKMISEFGIKFPHQVIVIPPVSYTEMLWLISNSHRVITDSGGVQKEAYWLSIPCVTLLNRTPWPQTLKDGWNQLIGNDLNKLSIALHNFHITSQNIEQFGDGKAANKINQLIKQSSRI